MISIAGEKIAGGMIYVGNVLETQNGYKTENCLINPSLKVAAEPSDPAGDGFSYWPDYSAIGPIARKTYLRWLAKGRCDPNIGIGYVFLFFYGLERRLFIDRALDEAPVLAAEVRRLNEIYSNGSFSSYVSRFLDAVELLTNPAGEELTPSLDLRNGYEIPLAVRMHLGRKLTAQTALTADDALIWILGQPDLYPRTAVSRCFPEFTALWRVRFDRLNPEGLKVRAPKRRLTAQYRSASSTCSVTLSVDDLPDIGAVNAPLSPLRDLFQACTDDLDAYSRLIGRLPGARGTAEAGALLHEDLADSEFAGDLRTIKADLNNRLSGEDFYLSGVGELCRLLHIEFTEEKISAMTQRRIATMLDRFDMGFEPDRRYGPAGLMADSKVVLFKASLGGPIDGERADYQTGRTLVEVAVLAALADGEVVGAELDAISNDLQSLVAITALERQRLTAQTLVALETPPKHQAALNRLVKLPADQRSRIAQAALSAVLADGRVAPAEVRYLEKLHKALGLPQDSVYSALHRGVVTEDEPVTVLAASWAAGEAVPAEVQAPAERSVDQARLDRVRQETAQVSRLLAGIFVEEDPADAPETQSRIIAPTRYRGLDAPHATLLESVVLAGSLSRDDFEAQARELRVLPDGAFDTINEWAFDNFDEPILEGDDAIATLSHLLPQLTQMGQPA
jgi:tellurite resistance protein